MLHAHNHLVAPFLTHPAPPSSFLPNSPPQRVDGVVLVVTVVTSSYFEYGQIQITVGDDASGATGAVVLSGGVINLLTVRRLWRWRYLWG